MKKGIDALVKEVETYLTNNFKPEDKYIEQLLQHSNGLIVGKAALCTAKFAMKQHIDALQRAFCRLSSNGLKYDKGCMGKIAIVKALSSLNFDNVDWYMSSSKCKQLEPVFGGSVDKGIGVRCNCIQAFTRFPWHRISKHLARHTGDFEETVCIAALKAISCFSGNEPELILLTKLVNSKSIDIIGACLRGLVELDKENFCLLEEYLHVEDPAMRLEVGYIIGETKMIAGLPLLVKCFEIATSEEEIKAFIHFISSIRCTESIDFLESLKDDGRFGALAEELLKGMQSN